MFGSIIVHIGCCLNNRKARFARHDNVHEDHDYHTYDEVGTIFYRNDSNLRSPDTNRNEGQSRSLQQTRSVSTRLHLQSTDDDTTELNTDFLYDDVTHSDVPEVHGQDMSICSDDTIFCTSDLTLTQFTVIPSLHNRESIDQTNESTNTATPSHQHSQNSDDSESESTNNVMVGNVGDEYENNYQLLDSHLYIEVLEERHRSISSTDFYSNEVQQLESESTKEPDYINLKL